MTLFLETKHLILKAPQQSDLDNLIALRTDPDVQKYIRNGNIQTKEEVQEFLDIAISYQKKYGIGYCSVFEKDSSEFVGQAGIFHLGFNDSQPDIELGYRLHKKFWGKGYATELAKALIEWGFQHLSVDKLIAIIHPENKASQKVAQKSGFDKKDEMFLYMGIEVFQYEIYKNDAVELVPYDKQWPQKAEDEMKILREAFTQIPILDMQHVGSTAIPGMSAKPVIDIQIAVESLEKIKQFAIDTLKSLGYQYWQDNPDSERMFFVKGMPPFGEKRSHHVHITGIDSRHFKEKAIFKKYLISHPEAAREYENLKNELAKKHCFDREMYTSEKTKFIHKILDKAK